MTGDALLDLCGRMERDLARLVEETREPEADCALRRDEEGLGAWLHVRFHLQQAARLVAEAAARELAGGE